MDNWLCNPTGKADGFRGYDWLMERNNLYTKVDPKTSYNSSAYTGLDYICGTGPELNNEANFQEICVNRSVQISSSHHRKQLLLDKSHLTTFTPHNACNTSQASDLHTEAGN